MSRTLIAKLNSEAVFKENLERIADFRNRRIRKIGDRITLKFTLPGSKETVAVETEVRWIRENSALHRVEGATGMGVRFVDLSPVAASAIQKFVESRDSLYYDDE